MEALILDQYETKTHPVFRTVLLWAFVMAVFDVLTGTADYFLPGFRQHNIAAAIISFGGIALLMLSAGFYHRKHHAGSISYLQAFSVSYFSAALALLIAAVLMYIFWECLADFDTYMQPQFEAYREAYRKKGYDEASIIRAMQGIKNLYTPLKLCIFATLSGLFFDLPLALLVSIFIKRKIKT